MHKYSSGSTYVLEDYEVAAAGLVSDFRQGLINQQEAIEIFIQDLALIQHNYKEEN